MAKEWTTYVWLSFCDPKKPEGSQFLGVCVVEADSMPLAVTRAWGLGCNPGGEVLGAVFEWERIPETWLNRLLTKAEATALQEEMYAGPGQ